MINHRKTFFSLSLYLSVLLSCCLLLLWSDFAQAHVRWFVDSTKISHQVFNFDYLYTFILIGAVGFMITSMILEALSEKNSTVRKALKHPVKLPFQLEWRLISVSLGIMLLLNTHNGVILAPNLMPKPSMLTDASLIIQLVIGLLLISQLSYVFSTFGILFLGIVNLVIIPSDLLLDYVFEVSSILIAFYLIGPALSRIDFLIWPSHKWQEKMAIGILTFGLGLQLIELAVHNKLTNPSLALQFMNDNSYLNFISRLGFTEFSNMHFVFAGGIAELTFGILLIMGIAIRLTALAVVAVFSISASIFGIHELIGHMPIMAVAFLIALRGNDGNLLFFLSRARLIKDKIKPSAQQNTVIEKQS